MEELNAECSVKKKSGSETFIKLLLCARCCGNFFTFIASFNQNKSLMG